MSDGGGADRARRLAASAGQRRLLRVIVALLLVGSLLLGVAGLALYVRGGGPLPAWASFLRPTDRAVLGPSSPAEVVLRTLRLAGYEHAVVGEKDGTVVVRVEVPAIEGEADIALTWQTVMAICSGAYPDAERVVVQVFSASQALLEVSAPGSAILEAVEADDAKALARASSFRYLSEAGGD